MTAPHDQHFLIDSRAIDKIARFVDVRDKRVLEIGPGEGPLTRALLDHGATVIAVELDRYLCTELEDRFKEEIESGRLKLINGDAVKCALPPFDIVVSNLPYSASSKLTFRLLDIGFEVAILMYQKEFGQRMVALPGTPECGRLSIMVQTYATVKPLLELSPAAFRPRPKVRSWVVKITPRDPPYAIQDRSFYAEVVRELFSHRRKTVGKGLKISMEKLGTGPITAILSSVPDHILKARPEELTLEMFAQISNAGSGA
jgi:16S rRNA (adenine1518-N6/adenine1519-N6)-dimethyltransferase